MQAIETEYSGYRFRSRLEARWAVVFDCLGLLWEYEPEGFELGNGLRYLPDFRLPELNTWLEIKPPIPVELEDVRKIEAFQAAIRTETNPPSRWNCYVCWGSPGDHEIRSAPNAKGDNWLLTCPKCRQLYIGSQEVVAGVDDGPVSVLSFCTRCQLHVSGPFSHYSRYQVRLDAAVAESRRIRFEDRPHSRSIQLPVKELPHPVERGASPHAGTHLAMLSAVRIHDYQHTKSWELTFEIIDGRSKGLEIVTWVNSLQKAKRMKDVEKYEHDRARMLVFAVRLGLLAKGTHPDGTLFVKEIEGKQSFEDVLGARCRIRIDSDGKVSPYIFPAEGSDGNDCEHPAAA